MSEPIALIDERGRRLDHPDWAVETDPDALRALYRDMVLARRVDTEATALQRTGELGLWSSCLGQEGIQVASAHALRATDMAFPTYRESAVAWCRGVDPVDLLGLYRGTTHGGWDPGEHGLGLFTIVIAAHVPHAVGYAMGIQRDGTDDAVIAYFGDGASSEGDIHEAMVFASVLRAPVVFLLQNNHWAISVPAERQTTVPFAERARGYGMPAVRVDGNDALASLAVTRWALEHARSGQGPVLVEAVTYRMGAHTTSDDPTRYRGDDEVAGWAARDPIARLREHLVSEGVVDAGWLAELDAEADALGERIRGAIRGQADPDPLLMFDAAHAEDHAQVTADRADFARFLGTLAAGEGDAR